VRTLAFGTASLSIQTTKDTSGGLLLVDSCSCANNVMRLGCVIDIRLIWKIKNLMKIIKK